LSTADIAVESTASAAKYFENTAPPAQATLDSRFWYDALTPIPERIKPEQTFSGFSAEIRDQVKSPPWCDEVNEWNPHPEEYFLMSKTTQEIKLIIIEDHKSRQLPSVTVDMT